MLHIYKASAGSGKTYTLTKQYLMLLLGYRNPETGKWRLRKAPDGANRHILAITFTNKATEEMIKRIITELAILAHREPGYTKESAYLGDFIKLFSTDEPTLRALASDTLDDLLADYVYFHVSTIDAFFQNVLRTFAREIEMPDNFDIEIDNNYTISFAVNEMLTSINVGGIDSEAKKKERKWLETWLTRYMTQKLDEGYAFNLFSRSSALYGDLVATFTRLMDENFKIHIDEISEYLSDINRLLAFDRALRSDEQRRSDNLVRLSQQLQQYGDYGQIPANIVKCVDQWALGNMRKPTATVANALADPSKRFKAAYAKKGPEPALESLLVEVCRAGCEYPAIVVRNQEINKAIGAFGLLGCLLNIINTFCKDKNLILLSETNSLLRDIINDDDTPFVYERLGYYLRHFLIDEFQDTSMMQWQNLRPLLKESLSHDNENLIIGDEKQCIYRFRNSDPELLGSRAGSDIVNVYGDTAVSVEGSNVSENNNWRSSAEVVKFNNSIFSALAEVIGDTQTYANVVQQINPRRKDGIAGHVKLLIEPSDADREAAGEEDSEIANFALDNLEREVDTLLANGYAQSDIAILVRTHSEGEAVIDRLLNCHKKEGWTHGVLSVTSADAVGVASATSVKMIIQILRLTQVPHIVESVRQGPDGVEESKRQVNPAYRRTRLIYCYEYFRHEPIVGPDGNRTFLTPEEALAKAIDLLKDDDDPDAPINKGDYNCGDDKLNRLLNFTPELLMSSGTDAEENGNIVCATLTTIVDRIISRYINPEVTALETGYISAFQDLVYDFCCRGTSDIRSFLDWWDRSGCRSALSSAEETAAISVMTIHQSKGLEFPCVIIPFANQNLVKFHQPPYIHSTQWLELDKSYFDFMPEELVPPMLPMNFSKSLLDIPAFAPQMQELVRQQQIDSLNVIYVAFTRAVNELIVISPSRRSKESFHFYLREAIARMTSAHVDNPDAFDDDTRRWILPLAESFDGTVYELGTPTHKAVHETVSEADSDASANNMPVYDPTVNETINTFTQADCESFDFDDPRCRGDFLHRVLSRVNRAADLNLQLDRAAVRAHLSQEQREHCRRILSEALSDSRVARWFEGCRRVVAERSFVEPDGIYRPDRVVWTADGHVDVVDFKFGEPEAAHRKQVSHYKSMLEKAGERNVRGFLWYIAASRIVEV